MATSQPLAVEAGLAALHRGGNAMDAALAAAIALVVVEPTGNGLGSDAFCIVWDGQKLVGLNASGKSPAGWTPDRFADHAAMPIRGWESVTVPGAVAAWVDLSTRFGKLPFETLFDAAIGYAERGFPVSPVIAELWSRAGAELRGQPGFAAAFLPDGRAPAAGELFRLPELGRSLRLIAETRGEAFYRGTLAERVAAFAARAGAALSESDLAAHANAWCETIRMPFAGALAHELPPNGQGIVTLMAFGILNATEFAELDPKSVRGVHLQIEAMKLAFADAEAFVADPASMDGTTANDLLDPGYLATRARLIDRNRAQIFGAGAPRRGGTVYVSTADAGGMMVSFIQSNYMGFGSGVVVPGTGISLQNRGAGFSLVPGHPNCVAPGKRPFHTIIPGFTMTPDGAPLASFGVMGGQMQAQGHLQFLMQTHLSDEDPQTALDAPRWRVLGNLDVAMEPDFDPAITAGLAALAHRISLEPTDHSFGFGGGQGIIRMEQSYIAGSDSRKDGLAGGF